MDTQTHVTLLERLREPSDPLAWDDFYQRYWRLIFTTARRRGCSDHTADEIVQEAMLAVFRGRDAFRYDPARGRFRDWLGTVVRNAVAARRRSPADRARPLAANRDHHARPAHAGELLAALEAEPAPPARRRLTARTAVTAAGLATALGLIGLLFLPRPEPAPSASVAVNFITEPVEAEVMIDGKPARAANGRPLTTPFTASVPPGRHRVAFVHPRRGTLDGGTVDFDAAREVVARWP